MNAPTVHVRVTAPRGTLVYVEVVEAGEAPALPPPTFDTTGEALPSEPSPAHQALRLVRREAA